MISLNTKHDILHKYIFEGTPKKVIAYELKISKNTVKKYIKEYETRKQNLIKTGEDINKDKLIEIICEKPLYDSSSRKPRVVTDELIEKIKFYLEQNEKYRQLGLRKQCVKSIDIHEVDYNDVSDYAKEAVKWNVTDKSTSCSYCKSFFNECRFNRLK